MQEVVRLTDGMARDPSRRLARPASLSIGGGEAVALFGPNGGGKTLLAGMLSGALPLLAGRLEYGFRPAAGRRLSDEVAYVSFRDAYGGNLPAYYQQRWNRWDGSGCPTVAEALGAAADGSLAARVAPLLARRVIELSTGELRLFRMARAVAGRPRLLFVDNPFIGLDAGAQSQFSALLAELARTTTVVLLLCRRSEVPSFVTHVVTVGQRCVGPKLPRDVWEQTAAEPTDGGVLSPAELGSLAALSAQGTVPACDEVVSCRDLRISYDGHAVLRLDAWDVRRGECWALTGDNGAGKSTLLSLVCADNPMAYACGIRLFGAARGRGESIWDIKRRIGYVSPELFAVCNRPVPAVDVVAGGLHDTLGLLRRTSAVERDRCMAWMRLFGADAWADVPYTRLSSGEQRLVLLVRAFVKSPPLLVLDEPFQGLDDARLLRARALLDAYVRTGHHTLIMVSHYENELPPCIDRRLHLVKHDEN